MTHFGPASKVILMTTKNNSPAPKDHPFAHLAAPPYRVVGVGLSQYQACQGAPIQPGTCCDYCGTGIVETYWVEGSDGRRFKVGNDCIRRTSDRKMAVEAREAARRSPELIAKREDAAKRARERRRLREIEKIAAHQDRVDAARAALPSLAAAFGAEPHPLAHLAARGMTRLDWAKWMLANAGRTGQSDVCRAVEDAKLAGLAVEVAPEPESEPEPAKPVSVHFGQKGRREAFGEFEVEAKICFEGLGGLRVLVKFRADDGRLGVWWTSVSASYELVRGDHVALTATVKDHDQYEGEAQTVLTRCKFQVVREAPEEAHQG